MMDRQITRQTTTREEIETAIDLIVSDGSLIVVNLLAWAASDVLQGVAKAGDIKTFRATHDSFIRNDKQADWYKRQKEHYNFAKHADQDAEKTFDGLDPEVCYMNLFVAAVDYREVYRKQSLPMFLYMVWMVMRMRDTFNDEPFANIVSLGDSLFNGDKTIRTFAKLYKRIDFKALSAALPPEMLETIEA